MSVWNVNGDAFSFQTLTHAINNLTFTPSMISGMGLFEEEGIPNLSALIDEISETIALVGVKSRGAPGTVVRSEKAKVHSITIPHLPQDASVLADSVQGIREFGSENMVKTVERERDKKLMKMRRQIDYTIEYHRMIALQGSYVDANGASSSLYTLFGGSRDSVDFLLGTTTTQIRAKCLTVTGHVEDGLDGVGYTKIHALCSTGFWTKLINHAKVEETYLNTQMAASLRSGLTDTLEFGDITWHRYRGTSSVKVADGEAIAFPVGVSGMYISRFAPANYMETVNTIGLPYYSKGKPMDYDKGVELEAQSNPLNMCVRPTAVVTITSSN